MPCVIDMDDNPLRHIYLRICVRKWNIPCASCAYVHNYMYTT